MGVIHVFLLLLLSTVAAAGPAGGVVGEWTLVEQVYEAGSNNLADPDRPLHLELERGTGGLSGWLWAGDDRAAAVPWPSFAADRALVPVEVVERRDDPSRGTAMVRYRVRVEPGRGFELNVTESYRLTDDDTLAATMTVRFVTPEGERGSYQLHRRFERVR